MPLIVEALSLPDNLPHPKAIESFGDNFHGYNPEFWEFFYRTRRYLSRITETELRERYVALHRNLRTLTATDRDKIPIQSFLSSWYWHKKEHQTRLEFALRDLELPIAPKTAPFQEVDKTPIRRPRSPNCADVLYRYGDVSYLEPMLYEGKIRLAAAGYYRDIELGEVRSDDELNKHSYSPGEYIKIINPDSSESPIIGDLKRTKSTLDYYALCMSCDWDVDLLEDFGANCCVVIHDTDEFASRLERAAKQVIGGWYYHHNPVEYFDPYDVGRNQYFDAAMCKNFRFAYQREYRYIWTSLEGIEAEGFTHLELGSIEDIATIYKFNN
ncbi:hypothetical protein [Halomonas sp. I5-271120]|uniref:hypothetical protein n=1 Tax=Halomonas sp. I5-271120 TaxID=3061632 RepID=UPI002714E463|nr:hypothetical protein [Halomonas sp. I5-271120]